MFDFRILRYGLAGTPGFAVALAGLALLHAGARAQGDTPAEGERNPSRVTLRRDHAETFTGGQQLEITVRINASDWSGFTAMGLYEQVPDGWTFAGARAGGGLMPGVLPRAGASGVLEFVWINQSHAPIAFQYTLKTPPKDHGTRILSGQVEYRLDAGQQTSNVALSQLEGVANELPVITLRGAASMTVALNATFQDPGATARDPEDGDLSDKIETSGAVDTSEPGTYTLTYGVIDSTGNRAEPVRRLVRVAEPGEDESGETPGTGQPGGAAGATAGRANKARRLAAARKAPVPGSGKGAMTIPDISLGETRSGPRRLDGGGDDSGPARAPGETEDGRQGLAIPDADRIVDGASPGRLAAASGANPERGDIRLGGPTDSGYRFPLPFLIGLPLLGAVVLVGWWLVYGGGPRRRPFR